MMFDPFLLIITVVFMVIGMFVSTRLRSRFQEYSQVPLRNGMTGKQVAEKMLADHGLQNVRVISVEGQLTDHYNPTDRTVNLSPDVYHTNSVSAAAVAAHECGHAVQHATAYRWLEFRSKMVPIVNFSSRMMQFILMAAVLFAVVSSLYNKMLMLIVILQVIIAAFAVITLPVEYDASKRALAWLDRSGITQGEEHKKAKDALNWAARTYLVAALSAIATMLYFLLRFSAQRDER